MRRHLFMAVVPFVLTPLAFCQTPDFAHDLGLKVEAVTALTGPIPPERLLAIEQVTGLSRQRLGPESHYRGVVTQDGTRHEVILLQVPLTGELEGCRLALAVDRTGQIRGLGAWGNEELDEDPTFRWGLFLGKLAAGTASQKVNEGLTREAIQARVREIPSDRQVLVQALLAQRMIMDWNDMIVRQNELLEDGNRNPDFADARRAAGAMRGMSGRGRAFADLLGEEQAEEYREFAAAASGMLNEYASLDPDMPRPDAREAVRKVLSRNLCNQCHRAETKDGTEFRPALRAARRDLGLPQGVLLVGFDVAAALGDDGTWSQEIATAARAGLLLAQAAWDEIERKAP